MLERFTVGKCCRGVEASPVNPKPPQSAFITRLVVDLKQQAKQRKAVMACLQLRAVDSEGKRQTAGSELGEGPALPLNSPAHPGCQGSRPYCLSSVKYELCRVSTELIR